VRAAWPLLPPAFFFLQSTPFPFFLVCPRPVASNACRVTSRGAIAVDVTVFEKGAQYIAITVSSTRSGSPLADPEARFLPYNAASDDGAQMPTRVEGTGWAAAIDRRRHLVVAAQLTCYRCRYPVGGAVKPWGCAMDSPCGSLSSL
jgi:hypothetical protein